MKVLILKKYDFYFGYKRKLLAEKNHHYWFPSYHLGSTNHFSKVKTQENFIKWEWNIVCSLVLKSSNILLIFHSFKNYLDNGAPSKIDATKKSKVLSSTAGKFLKRWLIGEDWNIETTYTLENMTQALWALGLDLKTPDLEPELQVLTIDNISAELSFETPISYWRSSPCCKYFGRKF